MNPYADVVSEPQVLSQLFVAAVTASLNDDDRSAQECRRELVEDHHADEVVQVAVGLMAALVLMFGPNEGDRVLKELGKWVAE